MQMYRQIRKGSSLLWSSRIPPFTTDCMQKFPETKTARSRKIMAKRQMREERRRRLRLIRRKTGQNLQAGPGKMPEKQSRDPDSRKNSQEKRKKLPRSRNRGRQSRDRNRQDRLPGAGTDRKPGSRFFRFFTGEGKYIREQAVLSRIDNEHLMDYLLLEQKRYESEQKHRDERGKQILSAFQLAVSLAAIVAVIGFLKDEPTVLVNILYIIGIIAAAWLWKMKK